jgi:dTDP-4-dehydrorhamnose reductase
MVNRPIRLLITGAVGCLGHQLLRQVHNKDEFDVVGTVRSLDDTRLSKLRVDIPLVVLDITSSDQIRSVFNRGFDVVINCAGVIKQRKFDPIVAIRTNSLAPHLLAAQAEVIGARLIHVSTDCVFSGQKGRYAEDDIPDPTDLYGRSKLLGEVTYDPHLTVRTSFIGPEIESRHGLLEWFLSQEGEIKGFSHVFWSGFTSVALSRILLSLAKRPDLSGLLHVAGNRIDKYTLLQKLRDVYDKSDITIHPVSSPAYDRSLDNFLFKSLRIPYPDHDSMITEMAEVGREV